MSTYNAAVQPEVAGGVQQGAPTPPAQPTGPPPSEGGQRDQGEAREEQRPRPFDFFRRLLRPQSEAPEPDPSRPEGPSGAGADGRTPGGPAPSGTGGQPGRQRQERPGSSGGAADSERLTLTRAELAEFVNGEVNRREAKRAAEADRERRRRLLDADPIGYADEERERLAVEEAQTAQRERMGQTLDYYDQHTLVPFLNQLPPEVVAQLRQETGGGVEGLEGRERLVARATELLKERIRAEERSQTGSSRRSSRVQQKQDVLREATTDQAPEPEVFGPGGGVAPPAEGPDMNTQLRALLAAGRGKR